MAKLIRFIIKIQALWDEIESMRDPHVPLPASRLGIIGSRIDGETLPGDNDNEKRTSIYNLKYKSVFFSVEDSREFRFIATLERLARNFKFENWP